jgi:hypothetical protein
MVTVAIRALVLLEYLVEILTEVGVESVHFYRLRLHLKIPFDPVLVLKYPFSFFVME